MSREIAEYSDGLEAQESRDTLFLVGGAALMIFGAGLILSTPGVRRWLGGGGIGNLIQAAIPDFQKYLKLRAM
ncbi:MAG: hypothetical protein WBY44_03530 [Bryobacteraceae bacterium]|jgi:hypothetical protein